MKNNLISLLLVSLLLISKIYGFSQEFSFIPTDANNNYQLLGRSLVGGAFTLNSMTITIGFYIYSSGNPKTPVYTTLISLSSFSLTLKETISGKSTPLVNSGSLSALNLATPGIVFVTFDMNAITPISGINTLQSGSFIPDGNLNIFTGLTQNFNFVFTGSYSGSVVVDAFFGLIDFNCDASKTYPFYDYTLSIPNKPNGFYTTVGATNNNDYTITSYIKRGTGLNNIITDLQVSLNVFRTHSSKPNPVDACYIPQVGLPFTKYYAKQNLASSFTGSEILLQYISDNGEINTFVLDSYNNGLYPDTFITPSGTTFITKYTENYVVNSETSVSYQQYRVPYQAFNKLIGRSPFGTWKLIIRDNIANDGYYWCVGPSTITIETCGSSGGSKSCC